MASNRDIDNLMIGSGDAAGTGRSGESSERATSLRRSGRPGDDPAVESSPTDEKKHAGHDAGPRGTEPSARASRAPIARRGHPRRVLVVDDSPPYRLALRTVLETMEGVQVVGEVASGEQAVATCRDLAPDLVFMDINLPGMDGIETTRRLKHDTPELVVIGLSVQSDKQTVAAMIEAGAAVHVSKGGGLPAVRDVLWRYL
ncbi:MAG: response regulator transcription factor [Candidatus Krumholzibacteriia bacterium]